MDPGYYSMLRKGDHIHLHQMLKLPSYNTVSGEICIDFRRIISKAENPLRRLPGYPACMEGVSYCGYEQVLDLQTDSEQDIFAESWDLLQIRPKGTLYIPMYRSMRGTDHYEPAGAHETLRNSGGFAEMECNLQTIGRPTGLNHSIDRVTKWIFHGTRAKLGEIADLLLGWDFSD